MNRRIFQTTLLAAGLTLSGMQLAHAQQTIKLTAAGGHPPVFLWVKLLDEFYIPEVDKRLAAAGGKFKVEWTKAWGGTLIKIGSESKGLSDGVADFGFVGTVFEAAKFPMQNVSYVAPFGTDNLSAVGGIVADMQKTIPSMGDAWTKNGLVYLGGAALDSYHLWTNFPVKSIDDLKGKKISAPGPAANWIRNTGAVAVAGSLPTYYEDIKSGVSNGAIAFSTGAWGAKLHEVAPHVTKVNFGAMFAGGVAMNKRRFDALPPEVQQVFKEVGAEYEKRFAEAQRATAEASLQRMSSAGATVGELTAPERQRWADTIPNVAQTWATDLQNKGSPGNEILKAYMNGLKKSGAQLPRDWSVK
jgi:TRAP-type C4-dicarboxylate transport system substrate-binding protein